MINVTIGIVGTLIGIAIIIHIRINHPNRRS